MTKTEGEAKLAELLKGMTVRAKFKSIPVTLELDSGAKLSCTLREFNGTVRDEWNEYNEQCRDDDGILKKEVKGYQQTLISKCLHKEDGSLYNADEVSALFGNENLNMLFQASCLINGLVMYYEEEDSEKND